MARDFSQFLPPAARGNSESSEPDILEVLGWRPFFSQQISLDDLSQAEPVRVTAVHRGAVHVRGRDIDEVVASPPGVTIGDWLLLDRQRPASSRILARQSTFKRKAAGTGHEVQRIAANVDTAFVTTSCNQDFNIARLERYVALAFEAEVAPVILLTKADLCPEPERLVEQAAGISARVPVLALNALDGAAKSLLSPWCRPGQTLVFLGSSGVGKSTLVNTLCGVEVEATQAIREADSKGRHTTTQRQMHVLPAEGYVVIDTPGMREIQLTDVEQGITDVFADIGELALQCRFHDCRHDSEPGCAVRAALDAGTLDAARLERWRKLVREERFNAASLTERRWKDKAFGKKVRAAVAKKKR